MPKEIMVEEEPKSKLKKDSSLKEGKGELERKVLEEIPKNRKKENPLFKIIILVLFPFVLTFFLIMYVLIFLFYAIGFALFILAFSCFIETILHLFSHFSYSLFCIGTVFLSVGSASFLIMWMNWAFSKANLMSKVTQHFIKSLWKGEILNEK